MPGVYYGNGPMPTPPVVATNPAWKNVIDDTANNPSLGNDLTPGDWPGINAPIGVPDLVVVCDVYAIPNPPPLNCPKNLPPAYDDQSQPALRPLNSTPPGKCVKSHLEYKK